MRGWGDAAEELFIYEYYYKVNWLGLPWPLVHSLKADIAWYKEQGVSGLYSQYHPDSLGSALNVHVAAHLLKDTQADVKELIDAFCRKGYGPAWKSLREVHSLLERAMQASDLHIPGRGFAFPHAPEVFAPEVLNKWQDLLEQAGKEAEGTLFSRAVEKENQLLHYTRACLHFLRLSRQALGLGRLGVETQTCNPEAAAKAKAAGVRLLQELQEDPDSYRGVLRKGRKNPYLLLILQELQACSQQ